MLLKSQAPRAGPSESRPLALLRETLGSAIIEPLQMGSLWNNPNLSSGTLNLYLRGSCLHVREHSQPGIGSP